MAERARVRVTQVHEVEVDCDDLGPDHADALRRAQADEGFREATMETIQ